MNEVLLKIETTDLYKNVNDLERIRFFFKMFCNLTFQTDLIYQLQQFTQPTLNAVFIVYFDAIGIMVIERYL